jgi:hypothetical protein
VGGGLVGGGSAREVGGGSVAGGSVAGGSVAAADDRHRGTASKSNIQRLEGTSLTIACFGGGHRALYSGRLHGFLQDTLACLRTLGSGHLALISGQQSFSFRLYSRH